MDREIDSKINRVKWIRRFAMIAALILIIATIAIWGPGWIRPSVHRSRIRTARVDLGPIQTSITSTGTVVPEFEQVISSPIDARVIRILKRPGDSLLIGMPIVELDVSASRLVLEKADQSISLKQNQQARNRLELSQSLIRLQSQMEIKRLELQSLEARAGQNQKLFDDGLVSEDDVRRAELEANKARTELKQLKDSIENSELTAKAQLEGLAMEMAILQKERAAAERELNLATAKSDRNGVLTWVVAEEGSTLRKGDIIARIADLRSFRVDATVSDVHAGMLKAGMPAEVKIGDTASLTGRIDTILPTIENGIMAFQIGLDDKTSHLLRSNLRVDVLIITGRKETALRLKKGPALTGGGTREVFVIRGNVAVRTPARLGLASFDTVEVEQGLMDGDEAIISDVSDIEHLKEVSIK
jgi:HlyD family secretion protein